MERTRIPMKSCGTFVHIQVTTCGAEIPNSVRKQLGTMWLRRYRPNLAVAALRKFKADEILGAVAWAIRDDGKVFWGALRTKKPGDTDYEVMVFVTQKYRRQGYGDQLLNTLRSWLPSSLVTVYPHDDAAKAFYEHRQKTYRRVG